MKAREYIEKIETISSIKIDQHNTMVSMQAGMRADPMVSEANYNNALHSTPVCANEPKKQNQLHGY